MYLSQYFMEWSNFCLGTSQSGSPTCSLPSFSVAFYRVSVGRRVQ